MDAAGELSPATRWQIAFAAVGTWALPVAPILILGEMLRLSLWRHSLAADAANSYVPAARELLHGASPYHPADVAGGFAFASPPIAAFVFAPFAVLPGTATEVAMAVLMLAAVLAALRIVGVRDWRCYAVAAISAPLVEEFQTANLSAFVALFAALLWRWRNRPSLAAGAAGMAVALKLFPWPMIAFLVLTRRFRAAASSVVVAVAGIIVPWAIVGFTGLSGYPHLLGLLERAERSQVYSVGAIVARFSSWTAASVTTYVLGALLLFIAYRARNDARAFVACVAATLVLTPVVWMHYFVLLFVVVAVAMPHFGILWVLPVALWVSAREGPAHAWQAAFVLIVVTATLVATYKRSVDTAMEQRLA